MELSNHRIPVYRGSEFWFWLDPETDREPVCDAPEWDEAIEVAALHEAADRATTSSKCYFVGGPDAGPVKIGHSTNIEERVRTLQLGCPVPLVLLALTTGGSAREAAYHWQFDDHRLHGEWFERCPEIEAEIARLNAPNPNDDRGDTPNV